MPWLYLSAPVRPEEIPPSGLDTPLAAPYRRAFDGVVELCHRHGWDLVFSGDAEVEFGRVLADADVFVAFRFDDMEDSVTANLELQHAVGTTPGGFDRDVVVFKLEPHIKLDEYWLGRPGAIEVDGDVGQLLHVVGRCLSRW